MNEEKARLTDIVGDGGILMEPEIGDFFLLDANLVKPLKPFFKVKPKNVEEVQKVVLWANETQTPWCQSVQAVPISEVIPIPPRLKPSLWICSE